jgi:hypothetical protein
MPTETKARRSTAPRAPKAAPSPQGQDTTAENPFNRFQPTWEHYGGPGDRIALVFWLTCVGLMALMILIDPLLRWLR